MFGRNDELLSMDKYHSQSGAKSTTSTLLASIVTKPRDRMKRNKIKGEWPYSFLWKRAVDRLSVPEVSDAARTTYLILQPILRNANPAGFLVDDEGEPMTSKDLTVRTQQVRCPLCGSLIAKSQISHHMAEKASAGGKAARSKESPEVRSARARAAAIKRWSNKD